MRTKQIVLLALFGTLSAVEFSADDFEGDSWAPKTSQTQAHSQTGTEDNMSDASDRKDAEDEVKEQEAVKQSAK